MNTTKKRVVSLLLCLAMFLSVAAPLISALAAELPNRVYIHSNGKQVNEIIVTPNNSAELTAVCDDDSSAVQWQIKVIDEDLWVNISDQKNTVCQVTYSMIKNMLNGEKTQIRCVATTQKNVAYSEPVTVIAGEYKSKTQQALSENNKIQAEQDDSDELNVNTITIEYLYEDGSKAQSDYVAVIQTGTSFEVTVISPQIFGFDPMLLVDGKYKDASQVELHYDSITQDETITVVYIPQEVEYRVEHKQQSINDDTANTYTVYHIEQKTGRVHDKTDAKALELDGFYAQPFSNIDIAADGSTAVEIFYDRLYYLVSIKLDGGHGVDPIYGRFDSDIEVGKPIKAGYVFKGWKKIQTDNMGNLIKDADGNYVTEGELLSDLPAKIPAKNTGYLAVWEAANTHYTVVFLKENADDDGYSVHGSVKVDAISGTVVSGKDNMNDNNIEPEQADYFKYNDEKTDKNVTVNGDGSTIVREYYDRNRYTMRFHFAKDLNGNHYISAGSKPSYKDAFNLTVNNLTAEEWEKFIEPAVSKGWVEKDGNATYYYYEFTAKYNQYIREIWPYAADIGNNLFVSWGTDGESGYYKHNTNHNIREPYSDFDEELIIEPSNPEKVHNLMVYYGSSANVGQYTYEIYFTDPNDNKTYFEEPDHIYPIRSTALGKLQNELTFEGMLDNVYDESNNIIKTNIIKEYGEGAGPEIKGGVIRFYYTREEFHCNCYNHGINRDHGMIWYGRPLNYISHGATYPVELPKDAYEFTGWYSDSLHLPETLVDFETATMPAHPFTTWAGWNPKTFKVRFFESADLTVKIGEDQECSFGSLIEPPAQPQPPTPDMRFVGWFYTDDGIEKAIDFDEFLVRKNIDIYAKWTSDIDVPYSVHFQLADGTPVAPSNYGYEKAGNNRTVIAKTDVALYPEYQQDYYPNINSHTILISSSDGADNSFTFIYIQKEFTKYTVKYINADTGYDVFPPKVVEDNKNAVVTENYKYKEGYVADAYQKRLIVSANDSENVIVFYYRESTDEKSMAPYTVTVYAENCNNPGTYSVVRYSNFQGTVGDEYSVDIKKMEGYAYQGKLTEAGYYDDDGNLVTIPTYEAQELEGSLRFILPERGAEIKLYYNCIPYEYTVRHVDYDTGEDIIDPQKNSALYGASITANALTKEQLAQLNISHYDVYGPNKTTLIITADEQENVFIFKYRERQVTYHYIAIVKPSGFTDFGEVSLSRETVKVFSDTVIGSSALESQGFKFTGWYLDEACTQAVSNSKYDGYLQENGKKLMPAKNSNGEYDDEQTVFYALFEPKAADLTITKSGADDDRQVFVYRITGSYGIYMEVTIVGNGEVTIHDLPIGTYTVTEQNGWSWRYNNAQNVAKDIKHTASISGNTVPFDTTEPNLYWLDAHADSKINKRKRG